jgi:hypothetical protein
MTAQPATTRKEASMDLNTLNDRELAITSRALSIHRGALRKKLARIPTKDPEHRNTMEEIIDTTNLMAKLNQEDLHRLGAA